MRAPNCAIIIASRGRDIERICHGYISDRHGMPSKRSYLPLPGPIMDKRIDRFKKRDRRVSSFLLQDGIDIFPFMGEGEFFPGSGRLDFPSMRLPGQGVFQPDTLLCPARRPHGRCRRGSCPVVRGWISRCQCRVRRPCWLSTRGRGCRRKCIQWGPGSSFRKQASGSKGNGHVLRRVLIRSLDDGVEFVISPSLTLFRVKVIPAFNGDHVIKGWSAPPGGSV